MSEFKKMIIKGFEMNQIFTGIPAFFAEENSKLLRAAEVLTGHNGTTVGFGTEGPFLRDLGMDTIIMGPGNIDQAHKPDEYMSIDMIRPTIDVLRKLVSDYCLKSNWKRAVFFTFAGTLLDSNFLL